VSAKLKKQNQGSVVHATVRRRWVIKNVGLPKNE